MKKKKKKKKRKEGRKLVCQLAKVTTQKISEGVGSKKTQSGDFFKNNLTSNKNFFTINNPSFCLSVCLSVCLSNYLRCVGSKTCLTSAVKMCNQIKYIC
jgi:hypothetical protein